MATARKIVLSVEVGLGNSFTTTKADGSVWPSLAVFKEKDCFLALVRSCYKR